MNNPYEDGIFSQAEVDHARADGYAEGVEAAAKVAERLNGWGPVGGNKVADHIAKQIRALTAPSGKEGDLRIPSDAPYIKPDIAVSGDEDVK